MAPTLTMRPAPLANRWGIAACDACKAVFRLIANRRSQLAASPPSPFSQANPPAILMSASRRPNFATTFAMAARARSPEERSTPPSNSALGPSRSARPSGGAAAKSSAATEAPRSAATAATTLPRAPYPPVTATTLPFTVPSAFPIGLGYSMGEGGGSQWRRIAAFRSFTASLGRRLRHGRVNVAGNDHEDQHRRLLVRAERDGHRIVHRGYALQIGSDRVRVRGGQPRQRHPWHDRSENAPVRSFACSDRSDDLLGRPIADCGFLVGGEVPARE